MNLYLIYSKDIKIQGNTSYVGTFIIVAENETNARNIAQMYSGKETQVIINCWLDNKYTECMLLKPSDIKNEQLMIKEYCSTNPMFRLNEHNKLTVLI